MAFIKRRTFLGAVTASGALAAAQPWLAVRSSSAASDRIVTGRFPSGFLVPKDEIWELAGQVVVGDDVIVRGTLRARPGVLVESEGGRRVIRVLGGALDLQGSPKTGWIRLRPGDASPPNWTPGDRLVVAPNQLGDFTGFREALHPLSDSLLPPPLGLLNGVTLGVEVLNLDRDIRFVGVRFQLQEGARPSTISNVLISNAGTAGELGEYPIHFHMNGDSTWGTIVEGVVVENGQNHAFVPHGSNGIRFSDCVAYNTASSPFWWDPSTIALGGGINNSSNIQWLKCLAAGGAGENVDGFELAGGRNNLLVDSCAVGMPDHGFVWPSMSTGEISPWTFRNNVSHNNGRSGIWVWQNTSAHHVVDTWYGYHNGDAGIDQGAYGASYSYSDCVLQDNGGHPIVLHASRPTFERMRVSSRGEAAVLAKRTLSPDPGSPVLFVNVDLPEDEVGRKLIVDHTPVNSSNAAAYYDFVECGLEPEHVLLSTVAPGTRIRAQRVNGTAWQMDHTGEVTLISAFHADVEAGAFTDVPTSHWAHPDIEIIAASGFIQGYPDGTFRPERPVTRAELVAMLVRASGATGAASAAPFSDLSPSHWAFATIQTAVFNDLVQGYPDGSFGPDAHVNRAEAAALLCRSAQVSVADATDPSFRDVSIGHWAIDFIEALVASNITVGYGDGTFRPGQTLTRAEGAVFIRRAWHL